jgi:hypothetical protein
VEYDGGTQTVVGDTYFNLEMDQSGTKTSGGTVNVNGTFIVQSAATYSTGSYTTTATGISDINGTLSTTGGTYVANGSTDLDGTLSGTGTYDANGVFDANNGAISLTGNGRLQLSSTITNLGTLSTTSGTVEYDGGTQTVKQDSYYNLEIDQTGVKTMSAANTVYGDLTINSGSTLTSSTSYGDITLNGGSFINNGTYNINTSDMSFTGGNNVSCGTISGSNTGNLFITKSSSSNTVTTTGNLDLDAFRLNEGTLVVDGETVTFDDYSYIYAGATLNLTSNTRVPSFNLNASRSRLPVVVTVLEEDDLVIKRLPVLLPEIVPQETLLPPVKDISEVFIL